MEKKEWTEKFKGLINEFDDRQKQLVKMLNKSVEKVEKSSTDTIYEVMTEIINSFNDYFGAEEKALKAVGYPDLQLHMMAHRAFLKKLLYLRGGTDESWKKLSKNVVALLKSWLIQHIQGSDMSYAPYVRVKLYLQSVEK